MTGPDDPRLIKPDRVPEGHLTPLLDPSADRWRDA
jgi:hypothetical protein